MEDRRMSTASTDVPTSDGRTRAGLWGGPLILGFLIALLGIFALVSTGASGLASVLLFGTLLVIGGALQIWHALRDRASPHWLLHLLGGLFSIVVGFVYWSRPLAGLAALTLLFGTYLVCLGLMRVVTTVLDRYPGWGWDTFYGLVALVLGAVVLSTWPTSSLWVIGALVGVELVSRGVAIMALAMTVRHEIRFRHQPAGA
jgi:uncharacterized membrane protein HdeD (DUF308 family)